MGGRARYLVLDLDLDLVLVLDSLPSSRGAHGSRTKSRSKSKSRLSDDLPLRLARLDGPGPGPLDSGRGRKGSHDYYRAVEDFFAALRGAPHLLSPKDIQLLRGWWRDGVPLHAVTSAIAETLARRRERGEADPVVSLSYCRHAVRAKVRQLGEMAAGSDAWAAVARPQ